MRCLQQVILPPPQDVQPDDDDDGNDDGDDEDEDDDVQPQLGQLRLQADDQLCLVLTTLRLLLGNACASGHVCV